MQRKVGEFLFRRKSNFQSTQGAKRDNVVNEPKMYFFVRSTRIDFLVPVTRFKKIGSEGREIILFFLNILSEFN